MNKPDAVITESRAIPAAIKRYVLWRDKGLCVRCGEATKCDFDHCPEWALLDPKGHDPDKIFLRCKECHSEKSRRDTANIARAKRLSKKGSEPKPQSRLKGRGFRTNRTSKYKAKIGGGIVPR